MAKLTEEEIHQKIIELDEQMSHLADILTIMVTKMDRIENATVNMEQEIREDLDELRDDLDTDQDRQT